MRTFNPAQGFYAWNAVGKGITLRYESYRVSPSFWIPFNRKFRLQPISIPELLLAVIESVDLGSIVCALLRDFPVLVNYFIFVPQRD